MAAAPDWFNILREDLGDFREEVNAKLDRLVTKEAFDQENARKDKAIAEVKRDLEEHELDSITQAKARAATRSKWIYGIVFAVLAAALAASGSLAVALIEAQQHLTGVKP